MRTPIATAIGFLLLAASCKKDGAVPAYVQLGNPVVVSANGQDTLSSRITEMWVYLDDQPVGVWESGRKVPLIGEGPSTVKLIAGVRKNGVIDDRIQYPFYATLTLPTDLMREGTLPLRPAFKYFDGVSVWGEYFEGGGVLFEMDTAYSDTVLQLLPNGPYGRYGVGYVDPTHTVFQAVSSEAFSISSGSVAFLEIDYSCDLQFQVGLRYQVNGAYEQAAYLTVQPTHATGEPMRWNKLYIDAGTMFSAVTGTDKRFFIRTELGVLGSGQLALDNVRLVRP